MEEGSQPFSPTNNKGLTFLPPLRQSENALMITSKDPAFFENSVNHDKELYELSLNKFELLTNQPRVVENLKLESYSCKTKSSGQPRATPMLCKWDSKEMPKLKVVKIKNRPIHLETATERRMRLQFEQIGLLKKKEVARSLRQVPAQRFNSQSYDFGNREAYQAGYHDKSNLWASCQVQDIQLRNQIIDKFYDLESRKIRFYRNEKADFYTFTNSTCIDKIRNSCDDN